MWLDGYNEVEAKAAGQRCHVNSACPGNEPFISMDTGDIRTKIVSLVAGRGYLR